MRNALYGLFVVVCLLAVIWPGYALFGARATPLVLGLPFSLFWNILWVSLSFVALLSYHLTAPQKDER